ncbi:MAG: hypothetical protein IPJ34_17620 [Myxococcales bacterium]|nr:hypothetical protein [Myxococcales bacterium]
MTPRTAALAGAMFLLLHGCGHAESDACQAQPDTGAVDGSSETNDPCCPARPPAGEECTTRGLICRYPCGLEGYPISRVDVICKNRGDGLVTWSGYKEYPCP